MKMYPYENKTFIRDKNRVVYTWLHRHDNEWLNMNTRKKVGNKKEQLIDWQKRDEEVLELVKVAVDVLRNTEDRTEKVTKTLVEKKSNKASLMQRNLNRLPRTKEFSNSNIETLEEFQLMRVKWAIGELAKEGEVKEWNVIIKAGLSKRYYENYKGRIDNLNIKYKL